MSKVVKKIQPRKKKVAKEPKKIVVWKTGSRYSTDVSPEEVDAEFEKLREPETGNLPPEVVVNEAKNNPVLHGFFEWDNKVCGTQHRLNQATALMRSIKVVYVDHPEKGEIGKYTVVPGAYAKGGDRRPFNTIEEIMKTEEGRSALLHRALSELLSFQRKYRSLQEFAIVFRAIEETLIEIKP